MSRKNPDREWPRQGFLACLAANILQTFDFHDDILRIVSEFFTENIHAAFVFCIVLDADAEGDKRRILQLQIVDCGGIGQQGIVDIGAGRICGEFYKFSVLRQFVAPPFRGEFAVSVAEVARARVGARLRSVAIYGGRRSSRRVSCGIERL